MTKDVLLQSGINQELQRRDTYLLDEAIVSV